MIYGYRSAFSFTDAIVQLRHYNGYNKEDCPAAFILTALEEASQDLPIS
jgi:hypothetical protein